MGLSLCRNLIPILLGGFSPKTFLRIVNYADGWIPVAGFGPLKQLEQAINGLRKAQEKPTKTLQRFDVFVLTYPNVLDSSPPLQLPPQSNRDAHDRCTDQIGTDIDQIKAMDVEHIIFGHIFSPIGKDMKEDYQQGSLLNLLNKKWRFPLETNRMHFKNRNYFIALCCGKISFL